MLRNEPVVPANRPPSRRGLTPWIIGVVVAFFLLQNLARLWTDYLWFESVDLASVWTTLFWVRFGLGASVAVVGFLMVWGSLVVADRISPRINLLAEEDQEEMLERFNDWVEPRVRRVRLLVAAIFGVLQGLSATLFAGDFLRFLNPETFGVEDPLFGNDVGFYVFRLPFLTDMNAAVFQMLVWVLMLTVAVHYLNGGIRLVPQRPPRVGPGVKAHVSVILALMAISKAVAYRIDGYELLYSLRGATVGAGYTDVVAQRPALNLLMGIAIVGAVLLLANIWRRGWLLPGVAVASWLVVSIVVGGIIPALVQQLRVEPDEINKEIEYVARNIEFTRAAYGIADVEVRSFAAKQDLSLEDLASNQSTIDNLRLWDPKVLESTYKSSQGLAPFYQFGDIDVDRYTLDGEPTQVELGARELLRPATNGGWVNEHLVFTHGFGAVVSQANEVTSEGKPDYLVKDIPPLSVHPELEIEQPRIYFGEAFTPGSFVIAGSAEQEVDRPLGDGGAESVDTISYDGSGGILLDNIFRRAAFALRYGDFNTLISGQITSGSRLMMRQDVVDRVSSAVPFMSVDSDPYLVILDGRLVWVLDMYTTSDVYPYSQYAQVGRLPELGSGPYLPDRFNYVRNSAKATVDAYDGTLTIYTVDEEDPILRSDRATFPDLFTDRSELPPGLEEHFRFPEDLFRVQSDMYRRYHVTDSRVFFNDSDPWDIALDPSTSPLGATRARFVDAEGRETRLMMPYYLLLSLPDEEDLSFLIMQPFTPDEKANMISFLIAKSDPGSYGQLIDYQLPRDRQFDGPALVGQDINQDSDFSSLRTLLGQEGSDFIQGQMLVVPIEESILFVQPIYLAGEAGQIPEFKGVVVAYQNQIALQDTLDLALAEVFAGFTPSNGDSSGVEGTIDPELSADVRTLLEQASAAFEAAQTALQSGDLATYQAKTEEAAQLIEEARQVLDNESVPAN